MSHTLKIVTIILILVTIFFSFSVESQDLGYKFVVREKTQQLWLLQDSELIREDLEQLDREIAESTLEIQSLDKQKKQAAIEELKILQEIRDDLAKGYSNDITRKTIFQKSTMLRVEESGQTDVTIFRFDKNLVWTVVPDKKGYIQSRLKDYTTSRPNGFRQQNESPSSAPIFTSSDIDSAIVSTGEAVYIHDLQCEKILWINKMDTTEFFVIQDSLPQIVIQKLPYLSETDDEEFFNRIDIVATNLNRFPIRSLHRHGERVHMFDIEKFETVPLQNSLFEIPAGYKKLTINDLIDDNF